MGYTTSTVHGIQVPDSAQANNIPTDLGLIVTALEGGSLVKRLSSATIAGLSGPQKPAGLVVYNTTTGRLQISDGTNFSNILGGGTYSTWSPTLTQGVGVTYSADARYLRVGNMTHAFYAATLSSNGTAGQQVTLTMPVTARSGNNGLGTFVIPANGTVGAAVLDTTTTVRLLVSGAWYTTQLTSGQQVIVNVTYEAA